MWSVEGLSVWSTAFLSVWWAENVSSRELGVYGSLFWASVQVY